MTKADTESTHPRDGTTLEARAVRSYGDSGPTAFEFSILFHPQPSRIGWNARVDISRELLLGRLTPQFAPRFAPGPAIPVRDELSALDDPFISREALRISKTGGNWLLSREPGKSLLQLNGAVVHDSAALSEEQLWSGVVLNLANRVVLHCRFIDRATADAEPAKPIDGLLGVSPVMNALRRRIAAVANSSSDVLLLGPTGVGKDVAAQAIHQLSGVQGPFVAVNMAALPVELAAASLFGSAKGAYTGADKYRMGYFEQASEGTLFLDEIGDTPAALQPMLLRAIQQREIQVVGGRSKSVRTRVVAATELDPNEEASTLRASLRYRLAAEEIVIPDLHQRREDIGPLALACVLDVRGSSAGCSVADAGPWQAEPSAADQHHEDLMQWAQFFEHLALRDWPGNIRELQHYVSACLRASDGVPKVEPGLAVGHRSNAISEPGTSAAHRVKPELAEMTEDEFFEKWQSCNFEVAAMSKLLGVSRSAVYRRIQSSTRCRLAADVPLGELLAALDECRGNLRATAKNLSVSKRGLSTRLRAAGVQLPAPEGSAGAFSVK